MSNISKDDNRFQTTDVVMEEKIHSFWDLYSKILIRFSWLICVLSFLITFVLTVVFFCFAKTRAFGETEFFLQDGLALTNAQRIQKIFGNDKNFRVHQQMTLYPALDIIIKRKLQSNNMNINETNMLNETVIDEV